MAILAEFAFQANRPFGELLDKWGAALLSGELRGWLLRQQFFGFKKEGMVAVWGHPS